MSKESKESKEPKNYQDYGYAGDEEIVISVAEFIALQSALNKAMQNGVILQRPQITKWVEKSTGKDVKFSMKAAQDGKIVAQSDIEATKSDENLQVSYDNNIFPEIFEAQATIMGIHYRQVENEVAKPTAELKRLYEERQVKGQMKVEDEEVVDAQVVEAPERPQPPMGVVRDEPETEE